MAYIIRNDTSTSTDTSAINWYSISNVSWLPWPTPIQTKFVEKKEPPKPHAVEVF